MYVIIQITLKKDKYDFIVFQNFMIKCHSDMDGTLLNPDIKFQRKCRTY